MLSSKCKSFSFYVQRNKQREIKQSVQGHTDEKLQSWDTTLEIDRKVKFISFAP